MKFYVRYIDTSDWLHSESSVHWCPIIPLDLEQYIENKEKINNIYSILNDKFYRTEEATTVFNKSLYLKLRKLMEYYWSVWGYDSYNPENYALEIATKIKENLESETWNPWGYIPEVINLVVVRRVHDGKVVWLNNAFYLGSDIEADNILDL